MSVQLIYLYPPAVVDGENFFFEDVLRHDMIEHWGYAINGRVGVSHPQHSIKLGKDKGHGRQSCGFSKHLHYWDATNLQQ